MANFNKFLPTTVFDVEVFEKGKIGVGEPLLKIDSLKISNFTQEGPEKTARGGINNEIIARHGKTTRLEMEDAIVNVDALEHFFGAKVTKEGEVVQSITVTDSFPPIISLKGETYFIDREGERISAIFTVPNFSPDATLNLTMEAEGDFGVIALNGEVFANKCGAFYTITLAEAGDCSEEETEG